MLTSLEGQGTTARAYCDFSGTADYNAKYVEIDGTAYVNSSAIRINGGGLLTNNIMCEEPYCLDAGSWQNYEPKITLDEDFANQIAAEVAKKLNKQIDPLEKNSDVDEVEIPPMPGFVEI